MTIMIDPAVSQYYETFCKLMLRRARFTFFPELLELYGKEGALVFLERFAGMQVRIPEVNVIQQCVRDTEIHHQLVASDDAARRAYLMHKHSLSAQALEYARKKAAEDMREGET